MACKFKIICKEFNPTAHYCNSNYEAENCAHSLDIKKAIKETVAEQ